MWKESDESCTLIPSTLSCLLIKGVKHPYAVYLYLQLHSKGMTTKNCHWLVFFNLTLDYYHCSSNCGSSINFDLTIYGCEMILTVDH